MRYSTIVKQMAKRQESLAKERDRLRELQDEIGGLLDVCERASESLDDAIAALSELV
jgi:hypothetical protein